MLLDLLGHPPSELTDDTRQRLLEYHWPGNVRELRNVVERVVHLGDLPALATDSAASAGAPATAATDDLRNRPFKEAKERLVDAFERDYLVQLLHQCGGNVSQAARVAGLNRVHIQRLMKKHDLREQRDP